MGNRCRQQGCGGEVDGELAGAGRTKTTPALTMDGMNNVTPADLDKVLRELRDAMTCLRVSEGLRGASVEELKAELKRRQTNHR